MNTIEIVFTTINVCIALFSLICAIFSARQTRKQTKLVEEQNEIMKSPDFALTTHLNGIKNSVYSVRDAINNTHK